MYPMERMMRFELILILALPGLQTPNKSAIAIYSFTATNVLYSQRNTIILTLYHYDIIQTVFAFLNTPLFPLFQSGPIFGGQAKKNSEKSELFSILMRHFH
jgi:hypothetical protein